MITKDNGSVINDLHSDIVSRPRSRLGELERQSRYSWRLEASGQPITRWVLSLLPYFCNEVII